ncbi:MAG: exodeoxyribonuclease V subunit alpha [Opitutales bacterium]|nr:exodeoxyribonuclease V subunit alpha [Opitutales bacterium]
MQDRWNLPAETVSAVESLLQAQSEGSTACRLFPPPENWGDAAAGPEDARETPLVLLSREDGLWVQTRKTFLAEAEIRESLAGRVQTSVDPDPTILSKAREIFKEFGKEAGDQFRAAESVLRRKLTLLTGGPGTGKTYTLARLLALLCGVVCSPERIAVAAPTGKAADRLREALHQAIPDLVGEKEVEQKALFSVADRCQTLHRLIRYNPGRGASPYGPDNPLPVDLLVVDEASMVDLSMWHTLLRALPAAARLVFVGDPLQLESVGQGNIFAAMVARSEVGGYLEGCRVHLRKSWRFRDQPDIARLAALLENGDTLGIAPLREEVIGTAGNKGLGWIEGEEGPESAHDLPKEIWKLLEAIAFAENPERALAAVDEICLLFPQRRFREGALVFSEKIQAEFSGQRGFVAYPIIVNRNDYTQNLRNGQVGIVWSSGKGDRSVWFRDGEGGLRSLSPAALPDYSLAWALTVHRAQGSEYAQVLVVLPREGSPLATRSLVYTAITRARQKVWLYGSGEALSAAIKTSSRRQSLL